MESKKVKIKYLLNFWKTLPEYPTQEDILYEIAYYLERDERDNGTFSQTTLDFIFRNATPEESVKISSILEKLKKEEVIVKTKETGEGKEWFKIDSTLFN
jgi:hypothetical protein